MNFIHFIDKSRLDSVLKNGIIVNDCYRGNGILIYPENEINFRNYSSEQEMIESEKQSNMLALNEKWERIGALGLRQNKKEVIGIKVQSSNSYWPIEVFIDIKHEIASEFGKLLDEKAVGGIKYSTGDTLSDVIKRIESPRFVLEGSFIVEAENDLKELMEIFQNAGGGIWRAHSFDCMIKTNISPESILEIIEYKNTHNTM